MIIFSLYDKEGKCIGRGFQCFCDPDNPHFLESEPDPRIEWERDEFLRNHDPNAIDGRRIKRRKGEPRIENLGLLVNKVTQGNRRLHAIR